MIEIAIDTGGNAVLRQLWYDYIAGKRDGSLSAERLAEIEVAIDKMMDDVDVVLLTTKRGGV